MDLQVDEVRYHAGTSQVQEHGFDENCEQERMAKLACCIRRFPSPKGNCVLREGSVISRLGPAQGPLRVDMQAVQHRDEWQHLP